MSNQKIVLIHGAVNTSNFGDVLFAYKFYNTLLTDGYKPIFVENGKYGISEFNVKELGYIKTGIDWHKADELVYMSGGYFGDNNRSLISSLRRWDRYFRIGLYFVIKKKPIYIAGIGGGPLYSWFNRISARIIMNSAQRITVRDDETKDYFVSEGVTAPIYVTADTALTFESEHIPPLIQDETKRLSMNSDNKKVILLHLTGSNSKDALIAERIVPGIKKYLEEDHAAELVLCYDNETKHAISEGCVYKELVGYPIIVYNYSSALQMCALIKKVDTVVTTKLHMGILGATFGKSVISFPMHRFKTIRFYQSIGQADRCVPFDDVTPQRTYDMLMKYADKPISIDPSIKEKARNNLRLNLESCEDLT